MNRILLTGGTGLLGQELKKIDPSIDTPTHNEMDITNYDNILYDCQGMYHPNIIIHCAALLDDKIIKKHPNKAIETNIIGTANVAMVCNKLKIRMIYISTDYVYKGDKGYYKEEDELLPFNFYAWTKLGGEASTRGVENHLIIRTSFGPSKFPYTHAFSDVWRSKDYVENVAKDIYKAAISGLLGVVNIGGSRKTVYEYAKERNPDILPMKEKHSEFYVPSDTSLNLTKWKNYKNGSI
jgi:dTDP-4-dehydrorhamnose reductase